MKKVSHTEFNKHITSIPGHVRVLPVAGTLEYHYGQQLVGVLVKGKPIKRLIPTQDELR